MNILNEMEKYNLKQSKKVGNEMQNEGTQISIIVLNESMSD